MFLNKIIFKIFELVLNKQEDLNVEVAFAR